jgi:hypothetical protein
MDRSLQYLVIEKKILQLDTRIELFEKSEAFGIGSFEHGEDAKIIHEDLELRQHICDIIS